MPLVAKVQRHHTHSHTHTASQNTIQQMGGQARVVELEMCEEAVISRAKTDRAVCNMSM